MSLNLDKVYSVKSNAVRDMRKAIASGEYRQDELDVSVVPAGYQIGRVPPAYQAAKAPEMTAELPTPVPPAAAEPREMKVVKLPVTKAAAPVKNAAAPVSNGALTDGQLRLLTALVNARAFATTPLPKRAGVWIKFKAVNDSDAPHNLTKSQLPGLTGGLRRRGLVDIRGPGSNAEIMVTAAGLAALNLAA